MLPDAAHLVVAARGQITRIDATQRYRDRHDAAMIDAREPTEYAMGRLPGTIPVPHDVPESETAPVLAITSPTVTADRAHEPPLLQYCRSDGRCAPAALSWLQDVEFEYVRSLAGGIMAWNDEGLPPVTP